MAGEETEPGYLANLRRELTRALARQQRAERERDDALAEVARLRELLHRLGGPEREVPPAVDSGG